LASAEGLGYMAHIIEKDHIEELLPNLISAYLQLLKKEYNEQQSVTVGLSNLIEAVIRTTPDSLVSYVDTLLQTSQSYLINLNSPISPNAIKNKEAHIRCFELIGKHYSDKVITFLIKQFDNQSTNVRIATFEILRHLVIKLKKELSTFKELIVGGVKLVMKNESNRARLELVQLICEMGKRGYLSKLGGNDLLSVVIDGASITDKDIAAFDKKNKKDGKFPAGITGLNEIREEADKILFGFSESNMSEKMDKIFWPFIFEFLNDKKYSSAFGILSKISADVAKRKKEDQDFMIDFTAQVNLPKPHQILARLLIMLHDPYARNQNGVNILRALYCLSPLFHEEVIEIWAKLLPEMKKYIDGLFI
jgi:maestro heat-like repeat-containing protein family member 1